MVWHCKVAVTVLQEILVSEVDEGQPCLVCDDQCPGFAFHEWR